MSLFTQEWLDARQRGFQQARQQGQAAPRTTIATPTKPSKHRNRKVLYKGVSFDSEKEARRYQELELLMQVGAIRDLRRQVSFDLYACNGERIARYVADFVYWSVEVGREIREDVKSPWTRKLPVYRLKAKLMTAQGLPLTEV